MSEKLDMETFDVEEFVGEPVEYFDPAVLKIGSHGSEATYRTSREQLEGLGLEYGAIAAEIISDYVVCHNRRTREMWVRHTRHGNVEGLSRSGVSVVRSYSAAAELVYGLVVRVQAEFQTGMTREGEAAEKEYYTECSDAVVAKVVQVVQRRAALWTAERIRRHVGDLLLAAAQADPKPSPFWRIKCRATDFGIELRPDAIESMTIRVVEKVLLLDDVEYRVYELEDGERGFMAVGASEREALGSA